MGDDFLTNIIEVNYTEEMEQSYIDYAMSVIIQRAIPDLRDGLKPVHRRILYAMEDLNLGPEKSFKKSARIIGDVLGKYHPHGDGAVYGAMVRLAQDFNTNYTLVKGQGNFGSIDGDAAAAMRYTEAKLEPLSMHLLGGLNKDIVDFKPNFDNSLKEPAVLPAKFFNLLVNGSTGIAVGMATNIPPHNLYEVNKACQAFLKDENITTSGLLKYIKGPDFPTGGTIINKNELKSIYEKGNGKIKIRANFEVEELTGGRKNLLITDIPYTFAGNKTKLIESLIDMVNNRKLEELSDVRDESNKDGIRIVLEVKKGVNVEMLKTKLYQNSRLEDTVPVNMLSIVNNRPATLSLRDMLAHYIEFLIETHKRAFNFDLDKLNVNKEVNEGLLKAYDIIDLIIEIIRGSKTKEDVVSCLVEGNTGNTIFKSETSKKEASNLDFTPRQADAIMKMQLQKLVSLEIEQIQKTLDSINENIKYISNLLNDENNLKDYISKEFDELNSKFKRKRKTEIIQLEKEAAYVEEEIVEKVYALIDRFNYLKIVDEQSYTRSNEETLSAYKYKIQLMSNEVLWVFADNLNFYQIKVGEEPIIKISERGTPLPNEMNILFVDSEENLKDKELIFTTKLGFVKRINTSEFETNRRQIISGKLNEDDSLLSVDLIRDTHEEIVLTTKENRELRFTIDQISNQKRMAVGVRGINLNKNDYLVDMYLDVATDLPKKNRGTKGTLKQMKFI